MSLRQAACGRLTLTATRVRARRAQAGAAGVSALVRLNNTLTELDVSCNNGFGADGCEQLRRAIESNSSLVRVDLRSCGAEIDDEFAVAETLRQRQERRDRAKIVSSRT